MTSLLTHLVCHIIWVHFILTQKFTVICAHSPIILILFAV